MTEFRQGKFYIDDTENFNGYIEKKNMTYSGGWLAPYFNLETAIKIYSEMTIDDGYNFTHDKENNILIATYDNGKEIFLESKMELINGMELYQIDGLSWEEFS